MQMRGRCLLNLVMLILVGLFGMSCGTSPTSQYIESPTSAKLAGSLAPPAVRDREQAVRRQLGNTTDGEARYALLDSLASDYFKAGMVADSMRVDEEIVDDRRIPSGRRSLKASSLANSYASDNYNRSQHLLERARALARETTPAELETLPYDPSYEYFPAEAVLEGSQHALSKRREQADLGWHDLIDPTLSERRHRAAANMLLEESPWLISSMVQDNHRTEALSYGNEMRWDADNRPDLKPSPTQSAYVDVGRAFALSANDDYDGALTAVDAAIDGFRQANVEPYSRTYAAALRLRLTIALALGRIGDYQADAAALESAASINPVVAHSTNADERESLILAARGQWGDAERRIAASLGDGPPPPHPGADWPAHFLRPSPNPESPYYKYRAALQMLYRLEDPTGQVGSAEIASYVTPLVGTQDQWNDSSTYGAYDEDGALELSMSRAMSEGDQGKVLAFQIAELFHMNATQGAMADGAARLAASTPELRALVEQEQDLRFERNTAHAAPWTSSLADKKLASLRKQIASEFPLYRQLVSPDVATSADLGKALREGEVYLDFYAGRDAIYAFVVHPGGAFHAIGLATTRAAITKQVMALRSSLDAGIPPRRPGDLAGFDLAAAAGLYQALIAPVQDDIKGARTVYIGTSGILASLPFNVLLVRPASSLADADWWISMATPVRVPSASALVIARSHPATHAGEPLIAFADPSFDGREPPTTTDAQVDGVPARAFPVDDRAASFDYHRVAPLPETLDEANSIAKTLNASGQSVLWGTSASRSEVMKRDLSNDRVVLFATHGIVAGEVPGWRKAGLALAYEGSGLADSILTADDIVTLRLNADWVVLSACNTGLVTGDAGDAMSELSRAFFAAGARSMLLTQWAVESRSATQVTTGVFRTYSGDSSLSKADAVGRTERDMASGKYGELYRHPYFWGAYVLTGDAAR
ncbi:CHAT domain-containing protein [Paraburkholderia pallida]|uniref:CHAT domain-containing protein n=1 Tax=Paraburkholderia pallida TaxID=2547399 RepID=A0A4P7D3H3_9BURK|nr:CHAT domain-containing protein [Paraburkholderia pallida]QBR03189.1 CHAT domain-containing protein [Paraburkholderia pallida]